MTNTEHRTKNAGGRAAFYVLCSVFVVLCVIAWIAWRVLSEPTTPTVRPFNVVLITIDTLRADRVGRGLTPNIDRLASRGISFSNVRSPVPLTLPSHTSIMTGLAPPAHGVRENGVVFDRKSRTLARAFRDEGYRTSAFVGAYVLNRRFGLDDGFDVYDDAVRRHPERMEQLEAERRGEDVVTAALTWLSSAPSPFFTWVHLYDPHAPYDPPEAFLRKAGENAYDGEVAYADAQVGRLVDHLESRGLSSSTVIAIAGDHGEGLGEHGEQTHGMLAYDSTLRAPMIVASPAGTAEVNDAPASLTALARVLLSAAGLSAAGFERHTDLYAETVYPRRAGWAQLGVLVEDDWKLILSSERELYDVRRDPAETNNLAGGQSSRTEAMAAAISKLRQSEKVSGQPAPEAAERLRALGYVSGSTAPAIERPDASNPARVIDAWTTFERCLEQLRTRDAAAALPSLRTLASQYPNAQVFQSTYAQALRDAGRFREAVAIYTAAVRRWPGDASLFHDLAAAARDAGDAVEASRAEQAALALDASSPMALNGLGLLHADAGHPADAAAAFERAARADPTNPSYLANLGNAKRAMNDSQGAESAYRRALEIDADFGDALNGLGAMLVQSGRPAAAVPLFERALRRDPELHEARLNLGIAYQQAGNPQKAAEIYRDVLKKTPPRFTRERAAAGQLLRNLRF